MLENKVNISRINSKNNLATLKVNEYYLHSMYNPIKEASQLVNKHYQPGNIHILFGYGLGYIAKELNNKFLENETLIIIEPIGELVVDKGDYSYLIQNNDINNLSLIFSSIIQNYSNIKIICSPNYDKLFPKYYLEVVKKVNERIELNNINENTLRTFSLDWQKNYIFNLKNLLNDYNLESLKQKYKLPVIVASGGPSLSKQISLLKEYRDNYILVASGSTINTLLHFGLEPDFVVSIDGGENNYRHFKNLKLKRSKLVYSLLNHYKIRENFGDNSYHFMTSDGSGLDEHYKNLTGKNLVKLRGGGSVASYALYLARYISSGPIALVGQDLAYTENKTHAEHNNNFLEINEDYIKSRKMFYTEGYNGEEVLTDHAFYSMKETFEILIQELKNSNTIFNCTEGGALIRGYQMCSFEKFCGKYIVENSNTVLESTKDERFNIKEKEFVNHLKKEVHIYKRLKECIDENLYLLEKTQNKRIFTNSILKRMDNNDNKFRELYKKTSISISIEMVTFEILKYNNPNRNETINQKYLRVYAQNKYLLENFISIIDTATNYTKEIIWSLEVKNEPY